VIEMTRPVFRSAAFAAAMVAAAGLAVAQQSILEHPARTDEERARDAGTKPVELYAFFGIEEGMTVADMMPGGGYNTILLSNLVGPNGRVYSGPDGRGRVATRVAEASIANVQVFADYAEVPAGSLDAIVTVRNVHDLINRGNAGEVLAGWMQMLKPGGILGVVDARTTMDGFDGETHRVNEQTVIDTVNAAGFELVESSDLLANPNDDYSRRSEEGAERYEIDRMTLKFRKPTM
jgi:predicted methyltransferase